MVKQQKWSLQGATLNSASFLAQFAISMVNLALVYYLRAKFSFAPRMVGLAASTYTLSYFIFCLLMAKLCSYLKPRHCVEIALFGMALSIFLLLKVVSVSLIFLCLALYGVFMSLLWPQIMGWISRGKENQELNRATGNFNFAWSFGAALAPLVTGFLVEKSILLPLYTALAFILLVGVQIVLASTFIPSIRATQSEVVSNREEVHVDHSTPLRYLCWTGLASAYIIFSVVQTVFPMYAQDVLHLPESRVGFLLLLRGFSTCLLFLVLGANHWWHFKGNVVWMSQVVIALVCLLGSFATHFPPLPFFALLWTLFGIFFSLVYSLSIFHGASGSVNRSQRMMIHEVILTMGTIIGNSLGSLIYETLGFELLMFCGGLFILLPLLLFSLSKRGRAILRLKGAPEESKEAYR